MSFTRRYSWPAMGSRFEAFLTHTDSDHLDAVAAAIEDEVHRLESVLSRFDAASEISRLNRGAFEHPIRLDQEVWELLTSCERYRLETRGYFDVTATAASQSEYKLILDLPNRTVRFADESVKVDLGGIGKGYALDRAADIVRRFGIVSALLNAGTSSLLAIGGRHDGTPWTVDVRDPADENSVVGQIELADAGFSCSAVRYPGQAISDVIDPTTHHALRDQSSCLVIASTATEAEALSTALLAMGRDRAIHYLQEHRRPSTRAGWVCSEAKVIDWLMGTP